MTDAQKRRQLEDFIIRWGNKKVAEFKQKVQATGLVASKELLDSIGFSYEIHSAVMSFAITIEYAYYGRMWNTGFSPPSLASGRGSQKNRYILGLRDWIESKGAQSFISSYRQKWGFQKLNYNKILTKIAWGIAIKRSRQRTSQKKQWLGKLSRLEQNFVDEAGDIISNMFVATMDEALTTKRMRNGR